jgi:hypothetical protein
VLGYFWQLMRPLMLFGILYVVFTQFVRLGKGVEFYPAILLTGVVLYTFFADATSGSVTAVLDRFQLAGGGEVRAARERFRAAGVEETEWQDDGRFVRVQVADPDGYRVDLYAF